MEWTIGFALLSLRPIRIESYHPRRMLATADGIIKTIFLHF